MSVERKLHRLMGPVLHTYQLALCYSRLVTHHHHTVCWLCVLVYLVKISSSVSQVRLRCQKGIPPALRGRAWLYLSGGKVKREQNHGKFQVRNLPLSLPHQSFCLAIFWFISCFKFIWNCKWNCGRESVLLSHLRTLMCLRLVPRHTLVLLVYNWKQTDL